ncbi:DUF6065 family protein [Bradyrhizobium sp. LTSP885]|uniref:DUF6065 family protein n=1 Tax=Bradyrhizobium sp. LTSP885 TaxID=1619232 RepID=UPI0007C719AD|nr:DUF6065 family protein [Bradyrhizobium sp. LTSP885]
MDLICYLHPGWRPLIRPAPARRDWMDRTPESFAYRCLPLNIANAHGWELLNPCAFDACWNGETDTGAVTIRAQADGSVASHATSLFGQGILTFHIPGIFRTPPGWNLWVGGSPNRPKDGIHPLTGIVETDWSPFTFTMNWRFTRPNHWIHFEAGEPICFFFPVQRALLDDVEPVMAPIDAEPDLLNRFQEWSRGRDSFVLQMADQPPPAPADRWQKHYYRGVDMSGKEQVADHRTRLRLKPFDVSAVPDLPESVATVSSVGSAAPNQAAQQNTPQSQSRLDLRKREWLLDTLERLRTLSPQYQDIQRRAALSSDEFLDRYYAANRPVILTGEMSAWPALAKWTPTYLKRAVGNVEAMSALHPDMGFPDKFLTRDGEHPNGTIRIGPAGSLTSLRYDLANNLIAQVVGRSRLLVLPAAEVGKLYNHQHVFSEIADIEDPTLPLSRFPQLADANFTEVTLMPGEMLFMPVAWWHQVRSIDFSVTVSYTNFRWPNDAGRSFPVP